MSTTMTHNEQNSEQTALSKPANRHTVRPRADIYETDDAWLIALEMPGVDENGTDVSVEKGVLTVSGEADAFDTEGYEQYFKGFSARRYERTFRIPEEVDAAAIDAHVKSGILRLTLPKAEEARPQKISVKAG